MDYNLLLDCGARQSQDIFDDYKHNISTIKSIKAKKIDYIIVCHLHQDHVGLIPALYRNGCQAHIYMPLNCKQLVSIMWKDSAKILESDTEKIKRKYGTKASPYFDLDDIEKALDRIIEVDIGKEVILNDNLSFRYYHANHIVNSAQVVVKCNDGINTKKVLYTSDLGNPTFNNYYCEDFETVDYAKIVIAESTYATDTRSNKKKDRPKDIEKIKAIVSQIKESGGKMIIPVFSLNRTQDVLTLLYETFHDDKEFNLDIVVDAVLGNKINSMWEDIITKNKELWNNVWSWNRIVRVTDWQESQDWQSKDKPMIVLASGGFISGGRVIPWAKTCLPSSKNYFCFVGYGGGTNSTVYQIKNSKQFPIVNIDGEKIKNNAQISVLNSFSSHIDNNGMLDYYSDINCEKIYLVHGDMERKINFAPMLKESISKKNRTTKVLVANKDTKIFF